MATRASAQPDEIAERIARGTEAWRAVKQVDAWNTWPVCDALMLLSIKAMKLAATDRPRGKQYALHFNALLKDADLNDIAATTRAAAIHCGHHRMVIAELRDRLRKGDYATYVRMVHPQAVWSVVKPLTLTRDQRAEAAAKKAERETETRRKAARAVDITEIDGDDLTDLIYDQCDSPGVVATGLMHMCYPDAVRLTGDEAPGELARILVNEFKLTNTDAYELIAALRAHFAPPTEPESNSTAHAASNSALINANVPSPVNSIRHRVGLISDPLATAMQLHPQRDRRG